MAHPSMLEQPRVQVKRPTSRREVKEMGDSFKAGHQLVVDLGRVRSAEDKRYIVAFLLGVTHGLNGKAKRINADVYLFAPSRFQIEAPEEFTGRSSSAEEWFEEQLREPLVLDEPEA